MAKEGTKKTVQVQQERTSHNAVAAEVAAKVKEVKDESAVVKDQNELLKKQNEMLVGRLEKLEKNATTRKYINAGQRDITASDDALKDFIAETLPKTMFICARPWSLTLFSGERRLNKATNRVETTRALECLPKPYNGPGAEFFPDGICMIDIAKIPGISKTSEVFPLKVALERVKAARGYRTDGILNNIMPARVFQLKVKGFFAQRNQERQLNIDIKAEIDSATQAEIDSGRI